MTKNAPRKIKIIGIIIVVIAIGFTVFMVLRTKKMGPEQVPGNPEVIESIPANGANGISVSGPISVTFNQPVNYLTITATSDPTEEWSVSQSSPNSVKINHKLYLRVATDYSLTVLQHGNPIGKIIFETAHEQNDPRFLQGLQIERDQKYPLLSLTPYEVPDYRVVYSAPLTFEIDLKSSIAAQDAITQVQLWTKSHNVDPSTHKYVVVGAPPTPQP